MMKGFGLQPYAPQTGAACDSHFEAFGAQDKAKILLEYIEGSSVQAWACDQADGEGYKTCKGLAAIGDTFGAPRAGMKAETHAYRSAANSACLV